jgi:hypothetical protein
MAVLADAGSRVPVHLEETARSYAIEWTASYCFEGDAFVVLHGPERRVILGYPVHEIAQAWQRTRR